MTPEWAVGSREDEPSWSGECVEKEPPTEAEQQRDDAPQTRSGLAGEGS